MLGSEPLYVLVMQLPLRANLKSGGPVFVLKGTAAKSDRWLKDASTNKDFFLDLQRLPVTKLCPTLRSARLSLEYMPEEVNQNSSGHAQANRLC
ncbi:uncharacterized protein HaLaN_28635 [Haematococcus lacustris]|uniref:Uncharacterized protein n=1 Tax=Haematococcus lacustris TaxID=44745 RepID=A0A6A0AAR1_HAELA|nr:uncharacterized protein HaLaN_28635 [Haematococcus lacustris]